MLVPIPIALSVYVGAIDSLLLKNVRGFAVRVLRLLSLASASDAQCRAEIPQTNFHDSWFLLSSHPYEMSSQHTTKTMFFKLTETKSECKMSDDEGVKVRTVR